jgi:hypothetical protein
MFNKSLKCFVLIYFLCQFPCKAQVITDTATEHKIIRQFNEYLRAVKLDSLIQATDFSAKDTLIQNGSLGKTKLTQVDVLTLAPGPAYTDAKVFADVWQNMIDKIDNKTNLYAQFFFNLAVYTEAPANTFAITLQTARPAVASFLIYYDQEVKVNLSFADSPSETPKPVTVDPDDLDNGLLGYMLPNVPNAPDLKYKLQKGTLDFFKEYGIDATSKSWGRSGFYIIASDVKGRITKKYYEKIVVNITIIPLPDAQSSEISMFFSVRYTGGGPFNNPPDSYDNAENALLKYYKEVSHFGNALEKKVKTIAYGKSF